MTLIKIGIQEPYHKDKFTPKDFENSNFYLQSEY